MTNEGKSYTISHAQREFLALGYVPLDQQQEDGSNKWIQENVLELLELFIKQGHSGSSAPYCADIFKKLALHELLSPLSGNDNEWNEVGDGHFQNNRCSHVFKDEDGRAYDIEGRIFFEWCERPLDSDEEGYPGIRKYKSYFTNLESRVYVEFPYTPTKEYIQVSR